MLNCLRVDNWWKFARSFLPLAVCFQERPEQRQSAILDEETAMASLNFLAGLPERITFWATRAVVHLRYCYRLQATDKPSYSSCVDPLVATPIEARSARWFQRHCFLDYLHENWSATPSFDAPEQDQNLFSSFTG
jgi:hypothetical protein